MAMEPRLPLTRELLDMLVAKPVEAYGILSRIETHLASLRDFMHAAHQFPHAMEHNAGARHDFMRDALVAVGNDVLAIKAMVQAMDKRLAALEGKPHAKGQRSDPV